MKVAGKTGTPLVEEDSWRHGWFAGHAPADKPEIALAVFLEKGHGPTDAAKAAREIFAAYALSRSGDRQSGARR
jgi:cell division protein FtsI/penicillin-binding protein 2